MKEKSISQKYTHMKNTQCNNGRVFAGGIFKGFTRYVHCKHTDKYLDRRQ